MDRETGWPKSISRRGTKNRSSSMTISRWAARKRRPNTDRCTRARVWRDTMTKTSQKINKILRQSNMTNRGYSRHPSAQIGNPTPGLVNQIETYQARPFTNSRRGSSPGGKRTPAETRHLLLMNTVSRLQMAELGTWCRA